MSSATVSLWRSKAPVRVVVLVLHGGAEHGLSPVRPWRLAYLRMRPIARAIGRAGGGDGVEVRLLRNRVRGWNAPDADPVVDARSALRSIHAERPAAPVILVGHSMGARVALRVAADSAVLGVCALAPWTPNDEPVEPVTGREVLILHGERDSRTSVRGSYLYAKRARTVTTRLARVEVLRDGHAMLRRPGVWHDLVRRFVLETAGVSRAEGPLAAAWNTSPRKRLRIRL